MKLTRKKFEEAVLQSLERLPRAIKNRMENIDVVVEDEASPDLLEEMGLCSPSELLGLYQGVPINQRGFYYGNVLPDKITLFQKPIEAICRTKQEIEEKVREGSCPRGGSLLRSGRRPIGRIRRGMSGGGWRSKVRGGFLKQ